MRFCNDKSNFYQRNIRFLNIYTLKNSKFTIVEEKNTIELQDEMNKSTIKVTTSTRLSITYRKGRKVSKVLVDLPTISQLDLIDICRHTT